MYRVEYEPLGQATSVEAPTVIVRPSDPLVWYVPDTTLQSALAVNVPLELKTIVKFGCCSVGTTPWKAGDFSVTAVRSQSLPVRPLAPELQDAKRIPATISTPMATAATITIGLRTREPQLSGRRWKRGVRIAEPGRGARTTA
jgi:hypothetical protein